ncbi:hypothetical protein LTR24_003985 [Lithohypha guttulata]|uniref:Uncharacterized protein n=1 Tax=Lithohypha guttulata TaxID=1690604 RepID=A0ABR0KD79_9EURO|nr:hypothetical protein LTR24_003985 [Lithohypha guttulata]
MFTRRCNPTLYLIGDLQIAAIATGSLVWLINLALVVLQAREYQYQKRKHQRSLRAKAKAKAGSIEDEISKAEKGEISSRKKIHHERKKAHSKSSLKSSLASQPTANTSVPSLTRPKRARTHSSVDQGVSGKLSKTGMPVLLRPRCKQRTAVRLKKQGGM